MGKYSEYVDILKNFINGEQYHVPDDFDIMDVMLPAHINVTKGIAGKVLSEADKPIDSIKPAAISEMAYFSKRIALADMLFEKFRGEGIDYMLFKGYVIREYYPVPELRSFSDIDFIIRKEDRAKSHELMKSLGFIVKDDWEPIYSYGGRDQIYEIHTGVMDTNISDRFDYISYFQDIFDREDRYIKTGEHEYRMSPEFHFIYLIAHLAKHAAGAGAGIRRYMDIALYIKHYRETEDIIDWEFVAAELENIRLRKFADTVLDGIEKWFGVSPPFEIERENGDFLEEFLDCIIAGGVSGNADNDAGLMQLKNTDESKIRTLSARIFPSVKTLAPRYAYLEERPWLLPFAWVHRVFKNRNRIDARLREAESILSADMDEVEKMKILSRRLGLYDGR